MTATLGGADSALSDDERLMLDTIRNFAALAGSRPGWRYGSVYALLLDSGRLFTPAPWPDGEIPGEPGRCYVESVSWACAVDRAYVEGMAWNGLWQIEHAWLAGPDGRSAHDPTWREPGTAYLGLPIDPRTASDLMGHHREPLLAHGTVCREWLQHGVPADLLIDCGRPVPVVAREGHPAGGPAA
ncbi:hypothetical protein [Kitasatospora sp. NBC_01302]|uniref:hypothetical protein n=1 Tax=Kitasatospora sp. NBC_01302 TaxID=2903575 RepID=UPI002E0FCA82|nr:hypothetical protein OG294_40830 [Kitasatospora sp. NBC_01302]